MRRRKVGPFIANKSELQASAHKYHSLSEVLFYCSWWKLLHLFISSEEIRLWKPQLMHSTLGICRSLVLNFKNFYFTPPPPSRKLRMIMLSINRPNTEHDAQNTFIICNFTPAHPQNLSGLFYNSALSYSSCLPCSLSLTTNSYAWVSSNQSNSLFNDIANCFALSL